MDGENRFYIKVDDTQNCDEDCKKDFSRKFLGFIKAILKLLVAFLTFKFPGTMFFAFPTILNSFNIT